jgi:enterochelin esterase-like enzyme
MRLLANLAPLAAVLLLAACQTDDRPSVTFLVVPDKPLEPGEAVYVTGEGDELAEWQPDVLHLDLQPDGSWQRTVTLHRARRIDYKISRGSWDTEAVSAAGVVPPNSVAEVKGDTTISISVANWKDQDPRVQGQVTGTVRYHRDVPGNGVRPRDVVVWLPPSYDSGSGRRYPVLYMHDGQNVFDPRTSYTGTDWQVDEVLDSLVKARRIEEIIVVGVYNTPDRSVEYGDTEKGRAYLSFLVNELKPMIDATYRTRPGREDTAIMGSSMGGMISFLGVWHHPEVFSMAGCLSPVFRDELIRRVRSGSWPAQPVQLYVDNGSDSLDDRLQPGVERMLAALRGRGFRDGHDLLWYRDAGAEHNEAAWARRVWKPIEFFFGTQATS